MHEVDAGARPRGRGGSREGSVKGSIKGSAIPCCRDGRWLSAAKYNHRLWHSLLNDSARTSTYDALATCALATCAHRPSTSHWRKYRCPLSQRRDDVVLQLLKILQRTFAVVLKYVTWLKTHFWVLRFRCLPKQVKLDLISIRIFYVPYILR